MRWIVGWSLKFPLLMLALAVAMITVGITQLRNTPVDALPEFAPPYVEVQTEALGLSAAEVEELIYLHQVELLNGTARLHSNHATVFAGILAIILTITHSTCVISAHLSSHQRIILDMALPKSWPRVLARVNVEGTKLRRGYVGRVVEAHRPLIGYDILTNGSGLLFVIQKFPGANTLEVTRGVEAKLAELQPGLSGIHTDTGIFRPASFIELAIDNLTRSLLIGFVLLALLLFVFHAHWR